MAKKKASEKEDTGNSGVSGIIKDITKKYGNVIRTGTQLLKERKESKILSISPAIDLALKGGIREGSWLILSGAPKSGKAQPITSIVYTPSGPRPIGQLAVGDLVCSPNPLHEYSKIIGIYPQGTRDTYTIQFSDDTVVECDKDHLWFVKNNKSKSEWLTKTAYELEIDTMYSDRDKWCIPVEKASFNPKPVVIDPFVLGVILADGMLGVKEIKLSTTNTNLLLKMDWALKAHHECFLSSNNSILTIVEGQENKIKTELKNLGLIVKKADKFIPSIYKYNSFEVRREVLRGILVANGHKHKNGYLEYTSASVKLLEDIMEVARSLGFVCKMSQKTKHTYRITISGDIDYLLTKQENINEAYQNSTKTIKSIQKSPSKNCVCIELENNPLYFTNDFNVTHNTTTAMQIAYNCQLEGRPIIYVNSEGRLSEMNFDIEGLDPEKMQIVTAEDRPLSAEELLDITLKLISAEENKGCVCIIDSISSLIPAKELEEDVTGSMRPGLPKILSNFAKKAGQIVPNNKIIMVMVTHIIANTTGYGPSKMPDSGIKIQYQSDTRMEVKSIAYWKPNENEDPIGQSVEWKIYWGSLGTSGVECTSWLKYGHGIDKVKEILGIAEDFGLIDKAAAWYKITSLIPRLDILQKVYTEVNFDEIKDKPDEIERLVKFNGVDKLYNFILANKDVYEFLCEEVKEMMRED